MASKVSNKSITQVFGSIAAAQTMVEQFPFSFGTSESGFTCSFDLLTAIFNMCSDTPLDEMVVNEISDKLSDPNSTWLQGIEESVKMVLETNLTSLMTCEMSPVIPDRLIGAGEFLKGSDRELDFSGEGVTIPVSALDFIGMLGNCPSDESVVARSNYMECTNADGSPLVVKDLWKHDDFNAFLWYVKNKGVYANTVERNKLIWDNRYKTKPYTKYERKPEDFFTKKSGMTYKVGDIDITVYNGKDGVVPFDSLYLTAYNASTQTRHKKRQILEVRYIDGDSIGSDSFQFRLPATNYYKTRQLTGTREDITTMRRTNKTIFEFNHDFLMSIRLYDAKSYLSQIVSNTLGQGNFTFNFSVTRESEVLNEAIDEIIWKVVNADDTEIDDCYYNFSNDEYDSMLKNALTKKRNATENLDLTQELINAISTMDKGTAAEDTKTTISTVLGSVAQNIVTGGTMGQVANSWKFNYDYQFELIRMLVYPLIRPLFSPKVMTVILLNTAIMGNPLKLGENVVTFQDILPYFMNIITGVIKSIKDMIVEMLYSWVIEKLTPLLTLFSLRLIMEQLEAYRKLIEDMLIACIGSYKYLRGNKNKSTSALAQADYVEIDPELEKLKQTPISNTNC